jgi:hypothetical protein
MNGLLWTRGVVRLLFDTFKYWLYYTGTDWDLTSNDDVFLQSVEVVDAARHCSVDQYAGRVLERRGA